VFLVIFKQPGANVIDTVDRIKGAVAPADRGDTASHQGQAYRPTRTLTIRSGGGGRADHLLITNCAGGDRDLPFCAAFGRRLSKHHVPLALLGACSLMWAFGYSLDNSR